jgi:hypothetical protein
MADGVRLWFRGPVRCGPTTPLFSIPIAIDWVSPNPLVGEWQPAQVLSSFRPVRVSNHRRRPRLASRRSTGRPRRRSKVDSIFPVNPCRWRANVRSRSISPAGAGAKPSPNPRARKDRTGTRSRSGRRAMTGAPLEVAWFRATRLGAARRPQAREPARRRQIVFDRLAGYRTPWHHRTPFPITPFEEALIAL